MIIGQSHGENERVGDNMHSVSYERKFALGQIAKKTIKVHKCRKALSPIFATLIILAIVTVLFIPVFIWATNMSSTSQDSWQQSGITATERIVIEEVSFNSTDPTAVPPPANTANIQSCTIYLRNIGETAVTINDVIISLSDSNIRTYQKIPIRTDPPPAPQFSPVPLQLSTVIPLSTPPLNQNNMVSVIKGDLMMLRVPRLNCSDPITTTTPFRIVNGYMYTIKVFTTRGVSDTYQVVA